MARLLRYAWLVLVYNLGVVAWGAYVRATGSGAGCGSRWPLCNGEVLPRTQAVATLIEFSHRATSGLALLSVVALAVWARRATAAGHPVRTGAALSLAFMISEALLGAGLVLFGLVADNASAVRALVVSLHLLNTFLLLASLTLTVWWAADGGWPRADEHGDTWWRLVAAGSALLLVSCSGAITALGDTLFPSATLREALRADLSATSHLLIRLRTIHPILAVLTALALMSSVWRIAGGRRMRFASPQLMTWLLAVQLAAGLANVLLLAPIWLQLGHLLLADAIWIAFVFLAAERLAEPSAGFAATPASRAVKVPG